MEQWSDKMDAFLEFNEQELLTHAGKVKAEVAKKIAEDRYEAFEEKRKIAESKKADEEDLKELILIMKNYSIILKVIFPVAIGLFVGRFVTPLFGLESPWASIAISTGITITLFIIIESITSKLTTGRTGSIPMGEIKNLHKVNKREIRQGTLVLADAFKEDPLFKILFGDAVRNSFKYTLVAEFMINYCYTYGDVYASSENFEGIMAITQDEYTYMSLWRMMRSGSIFPFLSIGFKSFMKGASALSPIDEARKKHTRNQR
jgi:hypothetical protein